MKPIVLVLLTVSLLLPLAACQGRTQPAPSGDRAVALAADAGSGQADAITVPDAGLTQFVAVDDDGGAAEEPPAAEGEHASEAAASPEEEAARLLEEARERARLEQEKRDALVQNLIEKARQASAAGDLDAARGFYEQALDADPNSKVAREEYRSLTFDRPSTVGEFLKEQRSIETVRREKAAADVRNYLERGRTFEAREDYESAVKEYQKALAIISWYTDQSTFGTSADRIRDLIENAKYKQEVTQRRERQEQIREAQAQREQELIAERERQMGKIRAYFDEATRAFQRGEYALAREYARQILRLDPQNPDADRLVCISHDAEHHRRQEDARRMFDDQWKSVMKDVETSSLPQVKVVEFPDDWLEGIAQRQPYLVGDKIPEADASIAAIVSTLESKRVQSLSWEGANLDQVVAYLRTITGLNFFITPQARAEKFDEVEVTLQVDDVAVKDVLDYVTEPYDLKWEPRNGVVVIATSEEIRGDMLLRFFDVKDLNVAIRNFVGQDINLVPSNFTPPEPPELDDPQPIFPIDGLVELIQQTIGGEEKWEDPATIDARNGVIIARNTAPILEQVQQLLDGLRANSGLLVNLEVRFLTAEDNFLRDVGVDLRGLGDDSQGIGAPGLGTDAPQDDIFFGSPANPYGVPFGINPEPSSGGTSNDSGIFYNDGQDGAYQARVENLFDVVLGNEKTLTRSGGLSFQHTYLDDTELEVILRATEKSERIQQITASRITVYNNQRGNISVLNQVAYVQDYEVEIAQASNIANPVIQTIQDGVVLDVRPTVSQDRRYVTLELRPTVALLTRPIATFSTSLASGPPGVSQNAPVVIQIPEIQVSRVRTTVVMPDGGTLLIGGLKFYEQKTEQAGIPFISKIPILSFLTSRKGSFVSKRNLLVLITAQIVPLEELEPQDDLELPAAPLGDWAPLTGTECTECPPANSCQPAASTPPAQMGPCGTPPPCSTSAPTGPPIADPIRARGR